MSDSVITFENVSVRYHVPHEQVSGIKEYAIRWLQRRIKFDEFWALRDVSFTVERGEIFGIIGRNGAGKSTTLKLVARVLYPTRGRLVVRGIVAPLLELGAGFNYELTGRENIYLNGALLGHSHQEMDQLLPSIIEFSEIGDFLDAPLRAYSTGMVARLGFSVATCIRPSVLLVDEVLAVGDMRFQEKCLQRMRAFHEQGTTILYVSHGMDGVRSLCQRAIWIENGQLRASGNVDDVVKRYMGES